MSGTIRAPAEYAPPTAWIREQSSRSSALAHRTADSESAGFHQQRCLGLNRSWDTVRVALEVAAHGQSPAELLTRLSREGPAAACSIRPSKLAQLGAAAVQRHRQMQRISRPQGQSRILKQLSAA